jgi:peptidoglycan/xylan/chitin deacetylase (PgdA/CDA1 family)
MVANPSVCIQPTIYLTFDDGPDPKGGTQTVLNVLGANALKATFFINMKSGESNPSLQKALIQRMVSEGHVVGNHGYEHARQANMQYYNSTTVSKIKDDFVTNELAVEKLLLRGVYQCPVMEVARLQGDGRRKPQFVSMITGELKMAHAGWRVEFYPNGMFARGTRDSPIKGVTVDYVAAHSIIDQDIVLLHDRHWVGRELLLDDLITFLKSGYIIRPATKSCSAVTR